MGEKLNLDMQSILNKEFNVDFKGYSASEVDGFLDQIIQDYQTYQQMVQSLTSKNEELERTNASLRAKLIETEGRAKVENTGVHAAGSGNIDILKRLSRLEEEVFQQKNSH